MERLLFRNPHLAAPDWVVAVHTFATLAMMGLIWFVQVVHYPLYAKVGPQAFAEYHALHVSRTTSVVAPLMLAELGAAVWLLLGPNDRFSGLDGARGAGDPGPDDCARALKGDPRSQDPTGVWSAEATQTSACTGSSGLGLVRAQQVQTLFQRLAPSRSAFHQKARAH